MRIWIKNIKEHWTFKKQIMDMAKSELSALFPSVIGKIWALLMPFVVVSIFWGVLRIIFKADTEIHGYPLFLWLSAGIIPWLYVREVIPSSALSIQKNTDLAKADPLPALIIPTSVNLSRFIIHVFLVYVLIILFRICGYQIDLYYIQIPFYMLLAFVFFELWGFITAPIMARSKHLPSGFSNVFLLAVFWFSGVIYDPEKIDDPTLTVLLRMNPIAYLIKGFRTSFINKIWFWEYPKQLLFFLGLCFFMLIISIILALITQQHSKKSAES